jgi:hypothetical protein
VTKAASGRIVLHNPHSFWYKPTARRYFHRSLANNKYEHILDYIYGQGPVYVYVDEYEDFSPPHPVRSFYDWVLLNGLNPFKFRRIRDLDELCPRDVFISFQYGHFNTYSGQFQKPRHDLIENLAHCKAFKVMHLTHYGYHTKMASDYAQRAGIDLFVSENNLYKNSPYFRHYYPWYKKDVYVLPFVPASRFQPQKPFESRKNRALATGTIAPGSESIECFFNNSVLHPMRKAIFENQDELAGVLDSYILELIDDTDVQNREDTRSKFRRKLERKLRPLTHSFRYVAAVACSYLNINHFRPLGSRNITYDIVEQMNAYKMCVVPEEIIDLPGISFWEAMACGTAFVGKDDPMYTDLGMVDGENYIAYDGTLEGLKKTLQYWRNKDSELRNIAESGHIFARRRTSPEVTMPDFIRTCRELAQENR